MNTQLFEPMVLNQVQKVENVNIVYKTYDLSIFKEIEGNRVPNLQHIRRLVYSIESSGMKCNPILVNEKMQVIDGQHRLLAAKECKTFVYFIILNGYNLKDVHVLNLNQKNWSKHDYLQGYAKMGIESYVKLQNFYSKNNDFTLTACIAMCNNTANNNTGIANKFRKGYKNVLNAKQSFEEGTFVGKDFNLAQEWADKIRMTKTYYNNYSRDTYVIAMIKLLQQEIFDFNEFMHKLRLQPTAMLDCATREQYLTLIEDIYNYKNRNKVNLRILK